MRFCLFTLALASFTGTAAAQNRVATEAQSDVQVKRDDFAYGATLDVDAEHALQRFVVPVTVYEQLTRRDAGDMAVFNASGSQVPHALRRASESVRENPDVNLPVFPLKAASQASGGSVEITVERGSTGAVTKVSTKDEVAGGSSVLTAYLMDTSSIEQPIRSLTFRWKGEASFVQHLSLATSDDLTSWHAIAHDVTVASLVQGGHRIDKERVELPPFRAKYLRVTWPDAPPARELDMVVAGLAGSISEPARDWANAAEVTTPRPGVYRFRLPGFRPVDRLRIMLPEDNTLAEAMLSSADSAEGPWSTRYSGLIYRLDKNGVGPVTINVGDVADPFWQLEVSMQGGGIGNGSPKFEVGWLPHELLFARRGDGPFTLAYGNANRGVASFNPQALASMARIEGGETLGAAKLIDAKVILGGPSKLAPEPPDTTLPVRRIVLWTSLAAAVLLLGWMSLRLFKQMGSTA